MIVRIKAKNKIEEILKQLDIKLYQADVSELIFCKYTANKKLCSIDAVTNNTPFTIMYDLEWRRAKEMIE